jgi:hypothetical protein
MLRSSVRALALFTLLVAAACGQSPALPLEPAPASSPVPEEATSPPLTPQEVVVRVMARYPERLVEDISVEERVANMKFLRDRVIEVGICGGLNLAWNRKQNGLRSIDAINWRHGDEDVNDVVDLAFDYDNPDRRLTLHWVVTDGPAGWDPYPEYACTN